MCRHESRVWDVAARIGNTTTYPDRLRPTPHQAADLIETVRARDGRLFALLKACADGYPHEWVATTRAGWWWGRLIARQYGSRRVGELLCGAAVPGALGNRSGGRCVQYGE